MAIEAEPSYFQSFLVIIVMSLNICLSAALKTKLCTEKDHRLLLGQPDLQLFAQSPPRITAQGKLAAP
jgi:hypothetical protein